MKKLFAILTVISVLICCCACSSAKSLHDGAYHAEFADMDSYGYKDYIDVVIENGAVVSFEADAVDEEGCKKSESEEYRLAMEDADISTYPEKYYRDFANQYLFKGNADDIDIVAGATISTQNLILLVKAVEQAAKKGVTDPIIVDRNSK